MPSVEKGAILLGKFLQMPQLLSVIIHIPYVRIADRFHLRELKEMGDRGIVFNVLFDVILVLLAPELMDSIQSAAKRTEQRGTFVLTQAVAFADVEAVSLLAVLILL
jgi:hypothetical protein